MRNLSPCTNANNTSPSLSQVEGITLSLFFLLEAVLIVAGNFLTIGLFATERKIRQKSLFHVVNKAFADLISWAVSLPLYAYLSIGPSYRLWKTSYRALDFIIGWDVTDTTLSQASLQKSFAVSIYCLNFPKEKSFFATGKQSISKPTLDRNLVARVHYFSTVMASFSDCKLHIWSSKHYYT